MRDALLGGTKTDVNMAEAVTAALGNSPAERIDAFAKIFLKSNGDPREKFLTKALQSVALGLLDEHLSHCVVQAAAAGGPEADEKIREASEAIARLVRS